LARINLAYSFSAALYEDNDELTVKCPGFATKAAGAGIMNVANAQAHTVAGAAYVKGEFSPSGKPEVVMGFRGTMFTAATNELQLMLSGKASESDSIMSYQGLKTVLTDANIGKKMLDWKDPKTGETVQLGYVHEGFYDALAPFIPQLVNASYAYVEAASRNGEDPIITITGHSLGAAISTIWASVVHLIAPTAQIHLVTFGSPRVGSPLWVKNFVTFDGKLDGGSGGHLASITRVVNENDVITLIPTSVGAFDSLMHAGPQLTLDFDKTPSDCQGIIDITSQYTGLLSNMDCAIKSVSDAHLAYRANVDAFLQSHDQPDSTFWCNKDSVLGF
jgi:hypothetical protein